MDILGTIFGSEARVKIMRLFPLNPEEIFDIIWYPTNSKVQPEIQRKRNHKCRESEAY